MKIAINVIRITCVRVAKMDLNWLVTSSAGNVQIVVLNALLLEICLNAQVVLLDSICQEVNAPNVVGIA